MKRTIWLAAAVMLCSPSWGAEQTKPPSGDEAPATEAAPVPNDDSRYQHLKELEWMVGQWVDQGDEVTINTTCNWTKNRNFMTRTFEVATSDGASLQGTQVIGWDPVAKRIRSWMFDSEGGFGEGRWKRDGNRWVVKSSQVLKGGRRASAINVLTYVDDNTFTWQSTGREVGGQMLPDVPEVTVVRKKTQ